MMEVLLVPLLVLQVLVPLLVLLALPLLVLQALVVLLALQYLTSGWWLPWCAPLPSVCALRSCWRVAEVMVVCEAKVPLLQPQHSLATTTTTTAAMTTTT